MLVNSSILSIKSKRLNSFLKFSISGFLSFLIDIGMFAFLTKCILVNLEIATATFVGTLGARIKHNRNYTYQDYLTEKYEKERHDDR